MSISAVASACGGPISAVWGGRLALSGFPLYFRRTQGPANRPRLGEIDAVLRHYIETRHRQLKCPGKPLIERSNDRVWLLAYLPPRTYQLEHLSDGSLLFALTPVIARPRATAPVPLASGPGVTG